MEPISTTLDTLFALLGRKEAELWELRQRVAWLESQRTKDDEWKPSATPK